MAKILGKAGFYKLCCTVDMCDEIEDMMSSNTDDIQEVYKSDWTIDEDGDVIVHYLYRATFDGFKRFSEELDSEQYHEVVNNMKMELCEF